MLEAAPGSPGKDPGPGQLVHQSERAGTWVHHPVDHRPLVRRLKTLIAAVTSAISAVGSVLHDPGVSPVPPFAP